MGCLAALLILTATVAAAQPTYSREIVRIFQVKCQVCHRPNDIAPFDLAGYQAAHDWAFDIRRVVEAKSMPPWKPVEGHGTFRDSFALTEEERRQIIEWVDAGRPLGDEADLPEPLPERGEWTLGEPDLVLAMPEEYTPPRGQDMYRCFVLPTGLEDGRYVSAADVLPGNRALVHHVILYLDISGDAERLDAEDPEPGYTCFGGPRTRAVAGIDISAILANGLSLGGWAPGTRPSHLPDRVGMELPRGARVVMQVHYYGRGRTGPDRTRLGLYFNKEKPEKRLVFVPIAPLSMRIPAGAARHEIEAVYMVPPLFEAHLVTIFPHMHLLGREIRAAVKRIGQEEQSLVYIDNWDFNWQGPYTYTEPVALPAFASIKLTCTYDNSEGNPRNPNNPLKTVTWGEGTEDEMCLVFLGATFDRERL